jgi:hypothetical protein
MFAPKYFAARYFAAKYFASGAEAPEGSIYASVSGVALVAAQMSAAGWASAGLLGASEVAALITSGTGFIAAMMGGTSAVSASLTYERARYGGPVIRRFTSDRSEWLPKELEVRPAYIGAVLSGYGEVKASLTAQANAAAVAKGAATSKARVAGAVTATAKINGGGDFIALAYGKRHYRRRNEALLLLAA